MTRRGLLFVCAAEPTFSALPKEQWDASALPEEDYVEKVTAQQKKWLRKQAEQRAKVRTSSYREPQCCASAVLLSRVSCC